MLAVAFRIGMVEQALDAGVMRFDTCARGRQAVLPSVLLAAIGGAGGDQASDTGAVIATFLCFSHLSCLGFFAVAVLSVLVWVLLELAPCCRTRCCVAAGYGRSGTLGVAQFPRRELKPPLGDRQQEQTYIIFRQEVKSSDMHLYPGYSSAFPRSRTGTRLWLGSRPTPANL